MKNNNRISISGQQSKTRWIVRATNKRNNEVVWIGHKFGINWNQQQAEEQANILRTSGLYENVKIYEQQIPDEI